MINEQVCQKHEVTGCLDCRGIDAKDAVLTKRYTCPDCRNEFVQPFVCKTCGAQKLYDNTVRNQAADIERLQNELATVHSFLVLGGELCPAAKRAKDYLERKGHEPLAKCLVAGCSQPPMQAAFCDEHNRRIPEDYSPQSRAQCYFGGAYGRCDLDAGHDGPHHIPPPLNIR